MWLFRRQSFQKLKFLSREAVRSAVLPRQVPSFQLGTVTLARGKSRSVSVRALIDRRLVFPTRWFSAAAAAENERVGKLGLRVRAHELSVRPSVCDVEVS